MAFQSELKVKSQIIEAVGTEQLFKLLSDHDSNILMKTLGLIRNLLSGKTVSIFYWLKISCDVVRQTQYLVFWLCKFMMFC